MAIVSTELEVQDITTLPKRTASGIDPDTDFVLGVEENGVAYKADIEDLGQSIVQGAKSNLLGRNQTVASAFSMLREETNEKIKESYGAPLVANQASDMKDKTRVYVYTGTGETGYQSNRWYYWNGVAWTMGGQYYSGVLATDTTLSLSGYPADSKAVGDALDEVNTELSSITDDVEQLQEDSSGYTASTSIAPEYSPSGIYAVGDYCMHNGMLYRCTTAISTAEAWNANHWTADSVKNIADGLKSDVSDLKDDLKDITETEVVHSWVKDKYIVTNVSQVDISSPVSNNTYSYVIVPCASGDEFTITGTGAVAAVLWTFIDSSGNVLEQADRNATADNLVITAPTDANSLIVNIKNANAYSLYVGNSLIHRITELEKQGSGISKSAKQALINVMQKIAWIDPNANLYYNILVASLNDSEYPMITATYSPGSHKVYEGDSLDSLKQYLTVKYYDDESSQGTTIAQEDYTVVGTLTEGEQVIYVNYDVYVTSFTVDVTNPFIYRLSNTPVYLNGTVGIDTGIKLLQTNKTFTIAFEFSDSRRYDQDPVSNYLFGCYLPSSPYTGIFFNQYDGGAKDNGTARLIRHVIRCTPPGTTGGQAIFDNTIPVSGQVGRIVRACIRYNSGTGAVKEMVSVNGVSITPSVDPVQYTYTSIDANLIIGARMGAVTMASFAKGYFNDFKVFDTALSDAEMQSYIEGVA